MDNQAFTAIKIHDSQKRTNTKTLQTYSLHLVFWSQTGIIF